MNLLTLSNLVHDKESAICFFQTHGIIHNQRLCRNGHQMYLSASSDRWRCSYRECRQEIGLRKGTWLQKSKLELRTVALFVYFWSKQLTSTQFCHEELSISSHTVVDWNNSLREVCAWRLLQTPTVVGGPGLHVEIGGSELMWRQKYKENDLFVQILNDISAFHPLESPIERKRLFLIDTDPGLDDAQAILMALAVDSINVIALTTVQGNSSSYATCLNALRLLKVADRLDIPVFPGCERPLISPTLNAHSFHGEDGFGEVPDKEAPSMDMAQGEHAVLGLIRLVQENPGEITLVALGPLTNIAMAIRLEPTLGTKLRNCYIMGGNYRGIGNVTRSAEFNFANDPEAAHIVLTELKCPITLITWELCTDMKQPLAFWERLLALPGRKAAFMHNIQSYVRRNREDSDCYIMCDELAMAAAINEATILESHAVYVEVETQGKITKGQLVSDWKNHTGKPANVRIVTKMDMNQVEELLINTYNE